MESSQLDNSPARSAVAAPASVNLSADAAFDETDSRDDIILARQLAMTVEKRDLPLFSTVHQHTVPCDQQVSTGTLHIEPFHVNRYTFEKRDKHENESVQQYVEELRRMAKTCKFGISEDKMIRDKLVRSVKCEEIRERLLAAGDQDLQTVIDMIQNLGTVGSVLSEPLAVEVPRRKLEIYYNMNHRHRGLALIFNHTTFEVDNLVKRKASNLDSKNLKTCFTKLGFEVKVYHNLTCEKVLHKIEKAAKLDFSEADCIAIFVLTHGVLGSLYAKDGKYNTERLLLPFTDEKCITLAGKPKLFFIQACQGNKSDEGAWVEDTFSENNSPPNQNNECQDDLQDVSEMQPEEIIMRDYELEIHPHFLVANSTVPGCMAWLNKVRGSWFMETLCKELQENAFDLNLLTILTLVNYKVAFEYESNTPKKFTTHQQKQMTCVKHKLTKQVQFNQKRVLPSSKLQCSVM